MSLAAAERARKASEMFIERVDQLIPDDPGKYHRQSSKDVGDKIASLKKNVAYLVLQNINLIDKVMDAEYTVHTLRLINEVEKQNRKERPYTFAAPDTMPESLPMMKQERAAKCESWCNPIIDFVIFNDRSAELESEKVSLTQKFISNNLRNYMVREDMVMCLEPHLAAQLFPNTCKDKDSDNDSGTGEEITSHDELDVRTNSNPNNKSLKKFDLTKRKEELSTSYKVRGLSVDNHDVQSDGNNNNHDAHITKRGEIRNNNNLNKQINEMTKGKHINKLIPNRFSEITKKFEEPSKVSRFEEISKQIPVHIMDELKKISTSSITDKETKEKITKKSAADLVEFPRKKIQPRPPPPRLKHEDLIEVPKVNTYCGTTAMPCQWKSNYAADICTSLNACGPTSSSSSFSKKAGNSEVVSGVLSNFSITCSQGIVAKKSGDKIIGIVQGVGVVNSQMQEEMKAKQDVPPSKSFSVISTDDRVEILSPTNISLTTIPNNDAVVNSQLNNNDTNNVMTSSLLSLPTHSSNNEPIPMRRASVGSGGQMDPDITTQVERGHWGIRKPMVPVNNTINMKNERDDNIMEGVKNHTLQRSMSFTPEQKNFSSKMSRGNKLRKSKRIEETQKLFQSNNTQGNTKIAAVKEDNLARDTSLRLIEAGGVSKSPFAGTGEKNIFSPEYNGAKMKGRSSVDLPYVRRGNAFGDL